MGPTLHCTVASRPRAETRRNRGAANKRHATGRSRESVALQPIPALCVRYVDAKEFDDGKGKGASGSPVRPKVPRQRTGADCPVVVKKWGNAHGAKGATQAGQS